MVVAVVVVAILSAGVLGSRPWPGVHVAWNPVATQSFTQQHELQAQQVATAAITPIRPDGLARLGSVLQKEAAVSSSTQGPSQENMGLGQCISDPIQLLHTVDCKMRAAQD